MKQTTSISIPVSDSETIKFYESLMDLLCSFDFNRVEEIMNNYGYKWLIGSIDKFMYNIVPGIDYVECKQAGNHLYPSLKYVIPKVSYIKKFVKEQFTLLWTTLTARDYIEMDEYPEFFAKTATMNLGRFNFKINTKSMKSQTAGTSSPIEITLYLTFEAVTC
jgi:hypothetical protein